MCNHVFIGKIMKNDAKCMHNFEKFFYKMDKTRKREFECFCPYLWAQIKYKNVLYLV